MFQTDCRRPLGFVFAAMLLAASAYGRPPQQGPAGQAPAGAKAGPVSRISIDDAVRLALEQNLSLQVQRLDPQIQGLNIDLIKTAWTPVVSGTVSNASSTNPVSSFFAGSDQRAHQRPVRRRRFRPTSSCRGAPNYNVTWNNSRNKSNSVYDSPNPALGSMLSGSYTQPLLRNFKIDSHPPAAARQQEEPGDDRRAASPDRGHHGPPGEERVLESRLRAREPEGAAAVAGPRPRIAQEQQVAGRHRHHGADRHRRGRGRSGPQRGGGDHRGGADHPRGRRAAGADLRSEEPGLLVDDVRSDGSAGVPGAGRRPGCRGEARPREPHRPGEHAEEPRGGRHQHPVLQEPDPAGPERAGRLWPDRTGRHQLHVHRHVPSGSDLDRRQGLGQRVLGRCSATTSPTGRSR